MCSAIGLTSAQIDGNDKDCLKNAIAEITKDDKSVVVTNGIVLELKSYFMDHFTPSWSKFHECMIPLFPECVHHFERFKKILTKLSEDKKSLRANNLSTFSNQPFSFPVPSGINRTVSNDSPVSSKNLGKTRNETFNREEFDKTISLLLEKNNDLESKVFLLFEALKEESKDKIKYLNELKCLQIESEKTSSDLSKALSKLGHLSTRNVNKRIKLQKDKVIEANEELCEKNEMISSLQSSIAESTSENEKYIQKLNAKLDKALVKSTKYRRRGYDLKKKVLNFEKKLGETNENGFQSHTENLKAEIKILIDHVKFLENEKLAAEEELEDLMKSNEIKVFHKGCYNADIRAVYEDLLCMGVGTSKVKEVIRTVLKNIAKRDAPVLPGVTFAKGMLLEARNLAQQHLVHVLSGEKISESDSATNFSDLNTLHSDGTSKKGRSYLSYDITTKTGETLNAGLRETSSGDAEMQLKVLQNILDDLSKKSSDKSFSNKVFGSIKNLMSDRCSTQKKFNHIFIEYRASVLPQIIEGWDNLTDKEKSKLKNINEFFCGLHYLVGLADQAEATLKVWEGLLYDKDKKVGSLAHGGYSNGESGCLRTIRTVCKSVQERGCDKSGRMVHFATFLKSEYNITEIPLYPFLGNRFNILFLNAAGVFQLYSLLQAFFSECYDENRLLTAVYHDLNVLAYKVGCRALGLIHKKVTGPFWRQMVESETALNMSKNYQKMVEKFEKWSADSSDFLFGSDCLFPKHIHKDTIFETLTSQFEHDESMTKPLLEMIFASFTVVSKRMLEDHLVGGKYDNPSEETSQEAVAVPTSNALNERTFGMLDYLKRAKPKALDMVYEGIIMFNLNKTKAWRDNLSKSDLMMVMERARTSVKEQKKLFFQRKQQIHNEKEEKTKQAALEKKRKAENLASFKEQLTVQIQEKCNGLWTDKETIEKELGKLDTAKSKRESLKVQLDFRKTVLQMNTICHKSLFFLTSQGKNKSIEELKNNLLKIIEEKEMETNEEPKTDNFDFSEPVTLSTEIVKQRKEEILTNGKKEKKQGKQKVGVKIQTKNKKRVATNSKKNISKKQRVSKNSESQSPIISIPSDLIGKLVCHYTERDEEVGWHRGVVIRQVGRAVKNPKFLIQYHLCDSEGNDTCTANLYEDFLSDDLTLINIVSSDFIDSKIEVLYEEDNIDKWWEGEVADVDQESKDPENPDFFVYYEFNDGSEDDITEKEYFLEPLIELYLNGRVRFLECVVGLEK
ncbi:putative leucine-rich repeat-containing protein DDB_G0290503 [Clytia hemisphaerica]|uniref:putative leucine-rich repeat-containing protein DDB_G0290503 n=1 Tax=Clytia hemisphaerica TaxID=252671 RepID=UPI0034D71682